MKRPQFHLLVALAMLLSALVGRDALAAKINVWSANATPIDANSVITYGHQDFVLPKWPTNPSASSTFSTQFQMQHIDSSVYNFIYFQITRCPCGWPHNANNYQVEVTYQNQADGIVHDQFLVDYALPGDHVYLYYGNYGTYNQARITNVAAAGHTSWDHISSNWTWTGAQPDQYRTPEWLYSVDNALIPIGHNCAGDMPAQDVPGSGTNAATMTVLNFVVMADGTRRDLLAAAISPAVTSVTPSSCGFHSEWEWCTPPDEGGTTFQCNVIVTYGGG